MTFLAIPTSATLSGSPLEAVDATEWSVRRRQHKILRQSATGHRRQQLALTPPGGPALLTKRTFTIRWEQLGQLRDTVEEILSEPGPHSLALWRPEFLAFPTNGTRTEFHLPWPLATDFLTPPGGLSPSRFSQTVKVGRPSPLLTAISKPEAEYTAGTPAPDEAWFLHQGTTFKLGTAPSDDQTVFARIVPLFQVFESEETEAAFQDPISEPRSLVLLER